MEGLVVKVMSLVSTILLSIFTIVELTAVLFFSMLLSSKGWERFP